jgi:hypothetical protein
MATHHFELVADYHQFYLQDEAVDGDLSESWTPEAMDARVALAPGKVGIRTARNMTVPVEVVIADAPPRDDLTQWDHVTQASIDVQSGRLVIAGCTDYFPDAARLTLAPGTYALRAYFGGLGTLDETGLEGDDHYRIVLWPDVPQERRTLKKYQDPDTAHETASATGAIDSLQRSQSVQDERMRILDMISEGKITADEGVRLLKALGSSA